MTASVMMVELIFTSMGGPKVQVNTGNSIHWLLRSLENSIKIYQIFIKLNKNQLLAY